MSEESDLEKTEAASARRLERAREEGDVPRSRELGSFALLLAVGAAILRRVEHGEDALPVVGARLAVAVARCLLRVCTVLPGFASVIPFRFGGQVMAKSLRVSQGVGVGGARHGLVVGIDDACCRPQSGVTNPRP